MQKVLLFKSPENCEKYQDVFEKNGYEPIFLPVLMFRYVNLDNLLNKLINASYYDGLVVTSQRAIEAIKECINEQSDEDIMAKWKDKSIFVVGDMTNNRLREELSLKGHGEHSGNAVNLSEYIIEQNNLEPFKNSLLFPCGNLKSESIPTKLKESNIKLDPIVVYVTEEDSSLKDKLKDLQNSSGIPTNLIFFSPSGVSFVVPILKELDCDISASNIIAIGPATEKRILEFGLNVTATAKEPSPSGIFSCFREK